MCTPSLGHVGVLLGVAAGVQWDWVLHEAVPGWLQEIPVTRTVSLCSQAESRGGPDTEGGGEGPAGAHQAGVLAEEAATDSRGAGAKQLQGKAKKAPAQVRAPGGAA